MNHLCSFTLVVTFLTGSLVAKETKNIELPNDPKMVVVSLDYEGGFSSLPLGHPPVILVRANGTVESGQLFGNKKPEIFKIEVEEVKNLLRFIIKENKFFEIDADAIQKKINGRAHLADARGAIIIVNANGKQKKVHFYGLSILATQHKENKELQQLAAIEKQLQQLKIVVQVGGEKAVTKWLKVANASLKLKHPEAGSFTLSNLHSTGLNKDGSRYCTFNRYRTEKNGANSYTAVAVTLPENKKTEPKTTVVFRKFNPKK